MITKPYLRSLRLLIEEVALDRAADALIKHGTALVLYREIMAELPRLPSASRIPSFRQHLAAFIEESGKALLVSDRAPKERETHLRQALEFLTKAEVDCESVDAELAAKWNR